MCLARNAARWEDITGTLAGAGLRRIYENVDYEVWGVGSAPDVSP